MTVTNSAVPGKTAVEIGDTTPPVFINYNFNDDGETPVVITAVTEYGYPCLYIDSMRPTSAADVPYYPLEVEGQ